MPLQNISKIFAIMLDDIYYFYITRNMKKMICTDDMSVEVAASRFAALGSEQRLGVLSTLVRAGPDGLNIGELGQRCGITGSTLTHHLKILSQAGLIQQQRQGRRIICAGVAFDEVTALSSYLLKNCCADCSSDGARTHG